MARNARKATPTKNGARLPSLLSLLVFLAGGGSSHHRLLQGAGAQSCEDEDLLCLGSEICTECTLSFQAEAACTEYIFDPTNACELHGVSYCCAAEAASVGLEECLNDPVTQDYLGCTLESLGCVASDMPCSLSDESGSAVGSAESRSSSSPDADVLSSATSWGASTVGAAAAAAAVALAVSFAA